MEEATANGTAGESSSDARRPNESFARRISTSLRFIPPASSLAAADTALPSPPSVSSTSKAPRRSLAHQPRLLGYEDDSLFELRGLPPPPPPPSLVKSSHPSSSSKKSSPVINSSSPRETSRRTFQRSGAAAGEGRRTQIIDDDQFRIGEEEEEETENGGEHAVEADDLEQQQDNHDTTSSSLHNERKPFESTNGSMDTASYSGPKGYQMDHRETSAILSSSRDTGNGGNIDDLERGGLYQPEEEYIDEDEEETEVQLQFEPTTKREKTWMWTSMALVAMLTFVSVAIAVDWIDWPGDGLGAD